MNFRESVFNYSAREFAVFLPPPPLLTHSVSSSCPFTLASTHFLVSTSLLCSGLMKMSQRFAETACTKRHRRAKRDRFPLFQRDARLKEGESEKDENNGEREVKKERKIRGNVINSRRFARLNYPPPRMHASVYFHSSCRLFSRRCSFSLNAPSSFQRRRSTVLTLELPRWSKRPICNFC